MTEQSRTDTTVTRRFEWDAAHRVLNHESKCKFLHGHRYTALVTVRAIDDKLDALDRVVDFGVLKDAIGKWIDEQWDHKCLLNSRDPIFRLPDNQRLEVLGCGAYMFPDSNPTAEVIARTLYYKVSILLRDYDMEPIRVRVHETPNCYADFSVCEQ